MENNNSFKKEVLDKIKADNVKMRPRLYFMVRPILFIFGLIMILVFLIYFLSFIFFIFRINDGWALTGLGLRGFLVLFLSLPWGVISFILLFLVIVETLLFHFGSAYRKPAIYSLLMLIGLVFFISFAVAFTSFHDNMLLSNKNRRLPWMGPFYEGYERLDFKNIHCGRVLGITDKGFVIEYLEEPSCGEIKIDVPPNFTKHKNLKIGDIIILVGERNGSVMKLIDLTRKDSEIFCEHRTGIPPR